MAKHEEQTASPVVSVILATYNRAAFISQAIESVLAQTFTDFELIIIDDGSTDGTDDVVKRYDDPRIIYKWVENGERSRARNIGIGLSNGRYIAFLDSDDWYLPHKLAVQVAALEANPDVGMALGGWKIVNELGEKVMDVLPWKEIPAQPTLEDWLFAVTATPITLLIRKEYLDRVNGFDVDLSYSEDVELWIRLTLAGCQTIWSTEAVAVVLVHTNNSLRNWDKVKNGRIDFLESVFANPEISARLKMSRDEVFAVYHLALSWQAYDGGLVKEGQQELLQAINLDSTLCAHNHRRILEGIINYSQYFLVMAPIVFVHQVFANLPDSLSHLLKYRREVLGKTWMSHAWQLYKKGELQNVPQSILHAVWYQPAFLKNRGILAMLLRSLVGQPKQVESTPVLQQMRQLRN